MPPCQINNATLSRLVGGVPMANGAGTTLYGRAVAGSSLGRSNGV